MGVKQTISKFARNKPQLGRNCFARKNSRNVFVPCAFVCCRDVNRGHRMFSVLTQQGRARAPASAAMAASDEIIISRIAAGEALAMRVLFARHHTRVYRWLLALVAGSVAHTGVY